MPNHIINPILRGFNPDPSICRVGGDFYIATSTFEWYPGVQIHHSKDLKHWRLLARPLDEARLLDMRGVPDSCGVWAPCLSWSDGLFYLVYTNVKRFDGNFKDTPNFVTTALSIEGPWSDPVYLNSSGFDPSLYHAEDGRKWYLNMVWDHRPGRTFFLGITMDEYLPAAQKLLGKPELIFTGTELDCTEAPHLYHFGDYYYLITAEGGTGYGHAITMARSSALFGPYEADPAGPVLTARGRTDLPLLRAGHGDIVQLEDGSFFLTYLTSRRSREIHSPLGRESAITPITLTNDGWFRLTGGALPSTTATAPDLPAHPWPATTERDDFDSPDLNHVYQWLRSPDETFYSLDERPGYLRLIGQESPGSLFQQSLIARRQTEFGFEATTSIEFDPQNFQQMAGLICYYNSAKFHYLYLSFDSKIGKHLAVMSCEADLSLTTKYPLEQQPIALPRSTPILLRATVDQSVLQFSWAVASSAQWQDIPVTLDMMHLTDQAGLARGEQFTGTFVGVACHDVSGSGAHADFDFFSYRNLATRSNIAARSNRSN